MRISLAVGSIHFFAASSGSHPGLRIGGSRMKCPRSLSNCHSSDAELPMRRARVLVELRPRVMAVQRYEASKASEDADGADFRELLSHSLRRLVSVGLGLCQLHGNNCILSALARRTVCALSLRSAGVYPGGTDFVTSMVPRSVRGVSSEMFSSESGVV